MNEGAGFFVDVSRRAIVSLDGRESLDLIQRISTNDVSILSVGGHIQTVLTNEKGRIVEVVTLLDNGGNGILVVGQGEDGVLLREWIEKFVIMEDIRSSVVDDDFSHFMIFKSSQFQVDANDILRDPSCRIFSENLGSVPLTHVLAPKALHAEIRSALSAKGLQPSELAEYEKYRVIDGIPGFPHELSTSYNPLEAGLYRLVSFTKGCYVGQEVVARLDTYHKVQRRLVRLSITEMPIELPATLHRHDQDWGMITSAVQLTGQNECRGLGYVRTEREKSVDELTFSGVNGRPGRAIILDEEPRNS